MSRIDPLVALLRNEGAEVERAALLVASDERRVVDVEANLAAIDQLAEPLVGLGHRVADAAEAARELALHLHGRCGFGGNEDDYYDPRNSYLDQVLTRRIGIPITLSILYMAVARRAGIPIEGISFPGRFLVRVGGPNGVIQDPYASGEVLGERALTELASRFGRPSPQGSDLEPATVRMIAIRMLINLENAHSRKNDHASALLACDRLVALTGDIARRRDRGLHAFAMGAFAAATDDLAAYVAERPDAADRARVETVLLAARGKASARGN